MLCLDFIVVTAKVHIMQWYCVLGVEFIVVTAKEEIVKLFCVVCGVHCGYSNNRYSAMVLCCLWS